MALKLVKFPHTIRIIGIVALYWVISISLVFVNKILLQTKNNMQDLSLFICWYQGVSGTCMMTLFLTCTRRFNISSAILFHPRLILLSILFVTGLILNMLMLKHIGVAFYQVARSTTLIFVVLFSRTILDMKLSWRSTTCCFIVVCGFIIGADQEGLSSGFSLTGITYGVMASLVIGLTSVVMKLSQEIKQGSLELTFYYNFIAAVILTMLMLSTGEFTKLGDRLSTMDPTFWFGLTYSGLLAVGMGWASTLQIQYTCPMTHHISISAKSSLQTVIAVMYFSDSKTSLWWFGTFLTIMGTAFYAFVKVKELSSQPDTQLINLTDNTDSKK